MPVEYNRCQVTATDPGLSSHDTTASNASRTKAGIPFASPPGILVSCITTAPNRIEAHRGYEVAEGNSEIISC